MRTLLHIFFPNLRPIAAVVLFTACTIAAHIGIQLITAPAIISFLAGISLAGLLILGTRYWPIVFLAIYITYLANGISFAFTSIYAIGYTLQATVAASLLDRLEFNSKFGRLRDVFVFLSVALATTVIMPMITFLGILLLQPYVDIPPTFELLTWGHFWLAMLVSVLVLTPLIIRWYHWPHQRRPFDILEILISFTGLLSIAYHVFWEQVAQVGNISIVYILLLPLMWIALRLGPRAMITSIFLLTVVAVSGAFAHTDAYTTNELGLRLYRTEVFVAIISVIFLILVSLEEERKEANKTLAYHVRELENALSRLKSQNEAKNNFLATLAHELASPIGTIVSYFELIKFKQQVTPEGQSSLQVIERRLESVQRMLEELLDVSRISEHKITLKKERIDLRDPIAAAAENVDHLIREKQQTLHIQLPKKPLAADADFLRLEQVFTNLLKNASKFTGKNGKIDVTAHTEGSNAVVRVTDTGIGIKQENLSKIFETYYQEKDSGAAHVGLGIGLALTQNFIRLHEGIISVKSDGENTGSTFTIHLPLALSPTSTPSRRLPNTPVTPGTQRVLVVDDSIGAAQAITKLLTLSGMIATYALSGNEAIEKFSTFRPDAVFLDLTLPDMNGYDIAKTLRNEHHFTGTIAALSGYGEDGSTKQAGFDCHLTKPVRLTQLLKVLQENRTRSSEQSK